MTDSVPARTDGPTVPTRRIAAFALVALLVGVGIMALLHVLPSSADVDPVRRTISEYAHRQHRRLFETSVLAVAFGSALVFVTLAARGYVRRVSVSTVCGALWVLGLVAVTVFPKTDWSVGPSVEGTIHRYASVLAFVCLPFAVWSAATALSGPTRWRRVAKALSLLAGVWLLVIVGAVVVMLAGGEPWWRSIPLGLVERLLAATEVAAVLALVPGLLLGDDHTPEKADPLVRY